MKTVTVKTGAPTGAVISPALHSQFIEHLGSCIYGGLWVGKDSPIPNIEASGRTFWSRFPPSGRRSSAGRAAASPTPTTGGTGLAKTARSSLTATSAPTAPRTTPSVPMSSCGSAP